ncbi:MAG TPA: polysaccharide lyase family 4 protein, partial [Bacteroidia bacterium]|nr:polysaccharide lyase family 4 protein [Bacteroidia bacterium]
MKSFSLFGYVVFFIFMLSCFLSHAQNLPGGLISSSTTAVTVTVSGNNITMANGIITMTINKTNAQITALHYNGNDLLGVGSGNGNTFYWSWTPTTLGAEETPANCTYTLVADPATNGGTYAEIKLSRPYNPANGALAAWDVDCHYSLLKGSQGFYASGVFSRQTSYPAYIMGETRFLGKINNGIFNWYSQDSLRNNFIPTLYDQTNSVVVVNAPKEVTQVETGIDSGQYLCKYSYTGDFGDMRVWGWSSVNENTGDPAPNATNTGKNIGLWMTCPSIEYYNGGPKKREISWVFLNMLNGEHYGMADSFSFAQGEAYQKVYGPFFIYCNTYKGLASASSATIATTLFNDAQVQTQVEAGAWPYTWFNNTAYAQKATRATVSGTLKISDPGNPIASAEGMWIGLAPDSGDFQHQAKTYQFWVKTGTNGTFTIPNVLPGTYNLNAFGPGSPGTFQRKNIIVTAGQTLNLGTISWTPPRIAPTVWEIGIPDRDTKEFFNGYSAEAGVLPPYAQWQTSYINYPTQFPNGVNYTIGTSNWAKDWNYAQVTNANNNWATSPWTVNFSLPNAPTTGSKAALHLALASNYTSHLTITVNGSQIYSSAMANA